MDAIVAAMSSLAGIDLAALGAACEKYGLAELAVFGSVVTGEARPDSDIDVLYVLRDGVHLGWAINDLSDDLEQVLGRPVDLISKGALHARLRDAVLVCRVNSSLTVAFPVGMMCHVPDDAFISGVR